MWTTACAADDPEVDEIVAWAGRAPRWIRSVGVACTTVGADGIVHTHDERPVGLGRKETAARLRATGLTTSLVVSNFGSEGFDGPAAARLLAAPARRKTLADRVAQIVKSEGFDAAELDLELMPTRAGPDYVSLAHEVHARLPAHVSLAIDVHPKTVDDPGWDGPGAHPYAALASKGAVLRLMTYDLSIGPVPPGPSTKASWVRAVLAYARAQGVRAEQLELGLPAYGYDFPPKGPAAPLRWKEAIALREKSGATLERTDALAPHFAYDGEGGRHEVWFDDATSLGTLLAELSDVVGDVSGVSVWGMGRADPNLGKCFAELGFAVATAAPR